MKTVIRYVADLVKAEPVRVATWLSTAAVLLFAKFGVVLDKTHLINAIVLVLPIVFSGEVGRSVVTPLSKLRKNKEVTPVVVKVP